MLIDSSFRLVLNLVMNKTAAAKAHSVDVCERVTSIV